ncbi:MAG TPA: hypothetical protein VIJ39_05905 [Solirubrobacteraceae bacterium]
MSLARLLAVALVSYACLAGAASATPSVQLHVGFAPDRRDTPTTIELSLQISGPANSILAPVTSLDLRLPAKMGLGSSTLGEATCEPAALADAGLAGCSANARIGFGSASAVVPVGSQLVHENASLDALVGPPAEDRVEVLFYVRALEPVFGALILPSVLEEDAAPYGQSLDTSVPLVEAWPEGPDLALETFSSSLGPKGLTYHREVDGRSIAYAPTGIRIPRLCPAGGYPFGAQLTFADGTHAAVAYHVPCRRG